MYGYSLWWGCIFAGHSGRLTLKPLTHTHTHKTISPEHYACIASISFLYKVAVTNNRGGPSYIYGRPRRAKYTNTTTACECDVYYALLFLVRFQGPERNKVRSRRCTRPPKLFLHIFIVGGGKKKMRRPKSSLLFFDNQTSYVYMWAGGTL
jgi:hypothetical protein